ncbi:ABC transporter permease [Salipaludibacillus agaradhaerens]|uniref:ABC transporter permease n=1 Tax=Salipaludibacillus agaradhaerens TaxID=76935 RepID=A0A9Q4B2U2_SALAG|nr:ABC transporter permease [Salipaludibacillus agaradhaerens]MCR6097299.1 ABC transporter permease [Salipaludibacillus agaradhaerens]MCR6113216.1 ABC transporter permease [Salipaludibacillus agaradhaerens]
MNLLIKNELTKLKRLKMVYVILVVSFLPFLINTAGMLMMSGEMDAGKYYYFVFNQYAILFPTLVFIFTGFFFYTEFQNRTTLNWISYPFHNFSLMGSKMIAAFILLLGTAILNHVIHLATLWLFFRTEIQLMTVVTHFFTSFLFSFLILLIIPVAALLVFMTRNILSVVIAGVAFIFVTTILLGADFSIIFPFSFAYRLSIQFFDSSMGYDRTQLELWGSAIFFAYIATSLLGLYKYSQKTRMS